MITENLSTLKIHKLSQAQYERELAAGRIDASAMYLTPDEKVDLSIYATQEQLNSKAEISDVNSLKSNLSSIQTRADNAYTLAESKIDSLSDLGITTTATELNYVDGVTSNIQTQLDNKAKSNHTHNSIVIREW